LNLLNFEEMEAIFGINFLFLEYQTARRFGNVRDAMECIQSK
jgi:hypothetical protein